MIITVVGTRPHLIKVDPELKQEICWTGQHYSFNMGMKFFDELKLPKPKWNLKCKGNETGKMIDKLYHLFRLQKPTLVVVFGDTNSSLAGALAAAYNFIPVVHIEAGLRSYRMDMPEEINRILIDHIATIKLCPNSYTASNLWKEGIKNNVHIVGDPEFDALNKILPIKRTKDYQKYLLLTLHRNFNVDNKERLQEILEALKGSKEKIIFPIHPRTEKNLIRFGIKTPPNIKRIKPTSYKEFISLLSNAKKVLTDSGGVQREAFWLQIPLLILRSDTEWIDIVSKGAGMLANNKEEILRGIKEFKGVSIPPPKFGANKKIREILYHYA